MYLTITPDDPHAVTAKQRRPVPVANSYEFLASFISHGGC